VKLRGHRVELGDVEAALCAHTGVHECAVVASEAEVGGARLVAYVVGESGTPAQAKELYEYLKDKLPDYMVPSVFVPMEALPLLPNGKLDRRALPAPAEVGEGAEYSAPQTPSEEIVCGIYADLLGAARVGATDDFFELGGHSLLAMQAVSRLRQSFGVEVALRSLFEAATPRLLAHIVEAARTGEGDVAAPPPLRPLSRKDGEPVAASFAQQRLWFIHQLDPQSAAYNVPTALRLSGRLDIEALQRTLTEVVKRHESLRTRFVERDGEPYQLIEEPRRVPLPVVDLSGLDETRAHEEALRLAGEEARAPFDLGRGPLARATLLRINEEEHVALWTMHHVVSDGWSTGVLVREVAALYKAYHGGQESPLTELAVQYADYAAWQREWLKGEVLEQQLSYWREQLADVPTELALPRDRVRSAGGGGKGGAEQVELSEEVGAALRAVARREGATLFMVLLASFEALLYRYTGQADVVVGTPVAGRRAAETEGLIGFFVNMLPVRARVRDGMSFAELVREAREQALGAYAHQDAPFELVAGEARGRGRGGVEPFEVAFVMQNAPAPALVLPGITLSPLEVSYGITALDLILDIREGESGLRCMLQYDRGMFERETVQRLLSCYRELLVRVAAEPDVLIDELELFSEEEKVVLESHTDINDLESPFAF